MIRSSVDLPQPDGPISETNSPRLDVEVDPVERGHAGLELLRDALDRDGWAVVHATCSGARRRTSFSASTIAPKKAKPSTAQTMFVAHSRSGPVE